MQGYRCIGGTEINRAFAFRRAARQLGYASKDVILNVAEYDEVEVYVKEHVDSTELIFTAKDILRSLML